MWIVVCLPQRFLIKWKKSIPRDCFEQPNNPAVAPAAESLLNAIQRVILMGKCFFFELAGR